MSVFAALHVPLLEHHWHVALLSALFWQALFLGAGSLSRAHFPAYKAWKKNKQFDWCMRIVAFFNAIVVCSLAWPMLNDPALYKAKLWGYNKYAGDVNAIVVGYFLWDIYVSLLMFDPGYILHGVCAFTVYALSFKPFIMYYGAVFILYELSTPFLHIHWLCDKVGLTGTTLQFVNGIVLLVTFFCARLVFGFYQSWMFFVTVYAEMDAIPTYLVVVYSVCNFVLNGLNVFWFFKMVDSVQRRFAGDKRAGLEGDGGSGLSSASHGKKEGEKRD
ncbi:TLC domain-containing protein [Chytriomyces sp. MP71]|nr:TLC domain-containing protein [Chytriomyces sp. MP71]